MRLNYYRFPENTPAEDRVSAGCAILLDDGCEIYRDTLVGYKYADHITDIGDTVEGISVTYAKQLLKQYGGSAWTCHCDRDGSCFEVTEIKLKGNNSKFKYNHHL